MESRRWEEERREGECELQRRDDVGGIADEGMEKVIGWIGNKGWIRFGKTRGGKGVGPHVKKY